MLILIGRVGPQCGDILGKCQCQNGGRCIQQLVGAFRCECLEGYGYLFYF